MSKSITINVSKEFSEFCKSNNFSISAFRGAKASNTNGTPVTWFNVSNTNIVEGNPIVVTYEPEFKVYDSLVDQVIPDGKVNIGKSLPANLGDSFSIKNRDLTKISGGGIPTGVRIINQTPMQRIVAGIAGSNGSAIAAFVTSPNVNLFLEPIEKITISLSGASFGVGTAIAKATGPSVMIDLTSNNDATIEYDILSGQWKTSVGAPDVPMTQIPADTLMQPFVLPSLNRAELARLQEDKFAI